MKKIYRYLIFSVLAILVVGVAWFFDFSPSSLVNRLLQINRVEAAVPGTLIKTKDISSVYYLGTDNKRYVFPSD